MVAVACPGEPAEAIAGFWRRWAAFAIDILLLAAVLMSLGLLLFRFATSLGPGGRVVGLTTALVYFAWLDSRIGHGRTPGKRLLGLRVVDRTGRLLSPARAALRFLVIAFPLFGAGLWLDLDPLEPSAHALTVLLAILWLASAGAIAYLTAFNRPGRQSLQDLAVDSFVVRRPVAGSLPFATRRLHLLVVGAWLLLLIPAVPGMTALVGSDRWFGADRDPLARLRQDLAASPSLARVRVATGVARTRRQGAGLDWTTYLAVTVRPARSDAEPKTLILAIAATVLEEMPDLLGQEVLLIKVTRGFDLGLARWSSTYQAALDGAGWHRLLIQDALRPDKSGSG
ncbi:MAG: RDD family protein [Dongiaceae bacterium]